MISTRVVSAHRDPLVSAVVRAVCEEDGLEVAGEAHTGAELLGLCRSERPDVAVMDSGLEGSGSLLMYEVLVLCTGVVVLCESETDERGIHMLGSGAAGCMHLDSGADHLAWAIRSVAAGDAVLHPAVTRSVLVQWRQFRREPNPGTYAKNLTVRELEVLSAMAEGLATKAIARRLGLAVKTVENHKTRVFAKLGARSQAHAITMALGRGLLAAAGPPAVPDSAGGSRGSRRVIRL